MSASILLKVGAFVSEVSVDCGPWYFELNTGARVPAVGLGTWKAPAGDVGAAFIAAVKVISIFHMFDVANAIEFRFANEVFIVIL